MLHMPPAKYTFRLMFCSRFSNNSMTYLFVVVEARVGTNLFDKAKTVQVARGRDLCEVDFWKARLEGELIQYPGGVCLSTRRAF